MESTILIIDDSTTLRSEVVRALKQAALFDSYRTAANGLEGFKTLTHSATDVVVCDLEMPHMDGLKFLQLVQTQPQLRDIPIIILTGNKDQTLKLQGLEQGATDYLTKPFDMAELVARVRIHLKMKKMQDQLKASREHFEQLSNTDPLTSLYNRRFFAEILETELQRTRRLSAPLSLLFVDIDHFKHINDRYGHQAGDQVLVAVTRALHTGLRTYDVASRYGGEEFAVVLPGTPFAAAFKVAERLRRAVASLRLPAPLDDVRVTVSIGMSSYSACRREDSTTLLKRADEALYQAKQTGRNRVESVLEREELTLAAV